MTEQLPVDIQQRHYRLTVEDFLLLDASGAFQAFARTELIDGDVLFMNAQHRPHARIKTELGYRLREALKGSGLTLLIEPSVDMPPHDVPEPDLVVTSQPGGAGLVPVASVALLAEVSDATLAFDIGHKARLYARHAVPEYWVVDVKGRVIHQLWAARDGEYRESRPVAFGHPLVAATLAGLTVLTDDL